VCPTEISPWSGLGPSPFNKLGHTSLFSTAPVGDMLWSMKNPAHKWKFRNYFRANAYGWRASKLASQRLKEALSEIKGVRRSDPVAAAEGAILLMEKLWPALAHVDTSSGALGTAVGRTVHVLIDMILSAPADEELRQRWLDRLWAAVSDDGVDYLLEVRERWGELCGSPEEASRQADHLLPMVRMEWSSENSRYFAGTPACLSCLLAAGRYRELLDLVENAPFVWWHYRRYGVAALRSESHADAAIEYALASQGLSDSWILIARECEEILLEAGRADEAYRRFAFEANQAGTHLATFRALIKKYPHKDPRGILDDLMKSTPFDPGRWFAAAKTFGYLDLAADLAWRSPVNIGTLLRAARDHAEENPAFALASAQAALKWMAQGRFYEITSLDVSQARRLTLETAERLDRLEATEDFIRALVDDERTDSFVRQQLE
jgi:hypothetical protein